MTVNPQSLSKGCQLCQQGKWLCIFLTYLCNANCPFCPAPFKQQDKTISSLGNDLFTISRNLKNFEIEGISFSGGECFLFFDRLVEWLSFLKIKFPHFYFWAYTNGMAVDEHKLQILADNGLNEIRFNIAASNYNSMDILEKIKMAAKIFDFVAVEIPSIPEDYSKLEEVLFSLDEINVNYLNLHEYIIVNDNSSKEKGTDTFLLNKETIIHFDINSISNANRIATFSKSNNLKFAINNCSLFQKEIQMTHRRITMGNWFKYEHEILTHDGLLETILIYPYKISDFDIIQLFSSGKLMNNYFLHPKHLDYENFKTHTGTIAKIVFLPPMSIYDNRKIYQVEILY